MNAFDELVDSFSRLPGIGKKSASRIVNYILREDVSFAQNLSDRIARAREKIHPCSECGAWAEGDLCDVCSNPMRDRTLICAVEQPQDARTIEGAREYSGLYHVLGGAISPIDGIGPDNLSIARLVSRARSEGVKEVIIATNPTVEGDTTALYLQQILSKIDGLKITRLASGIPVGGDLEYADRLTLMRSFRGRAEF